MKKTKKTIKISKKKLSNLNLLVKPKKKIIKKKPSKKQASINIKDKELENLVTSKENFQSSNFLVRRGSSLQQREISGMENNLANVRIKKQTNNDEQDNIASYAAALSANYDDSVYSESTALNIGTSSKKDPREINMKAFQEESMRGYDESAGSQNQFYKKEEYSSGVEHFEEDRRHPFEKRDVK